MEKNKVFGEEELVEMGKRTVDLLTEAIDAGDREQAKKLANRMYREFSGIHDLYRDWIADMMDYVYRHGGPDELYRALRQTIAASTGPMADLKKVEFRRRVEVVAAMLRGHLVGLELQEDDEKVCIKMKPCGSGQRLFEAGAYDPPRNLAMIDRPHTMTWGLTDFPVYCTHAPVMELLMIEKLGWPVFTIAPGKEVARESCSYCLYKSPDDIPGDVYARLGKRRPGRASGGASRRGKQKGTNRKGIHSEQVNPQPST